MNIKKFEETINGLAISEPHYKNVVMAIRFFTPLSKGNNTKLALLAQLIRDRNKKYTTKSEVQALKDNLYGAVIRSRTFGYGPTHVMEVAVECISDRFVNESLQEKQLETLADFIYQPLITQETLKEAKQVVANRILRFQENPMNYSITKVFEHLGQNSTLGLSTQGQIEDLEEITVDDMISYHHNLLENAQAQLVIVGNFNTEILENISTVFKSHPALEKERPFNIYQGNKKESLIDIKPVGQATLIEVYQNEVSIEDELHYPFRLGNVILGQLPTSLLFQEVREKHSLCYSVGSRLIAYEGLLFLVTSLDAQNINLASSLMHEQVEKIKNGEFTQAQFDAALKMMVSTFDTIKDDETSLMNFIFDASYRNLSFDIKDHQQYYQAVTKEQIVEAFSKTVPILQFQLKGEN